MSAGALPPCGLYRTTREIAGVPAGRLVFFHNHGEPGPGLYLPDGWKLNRARFPERGTPLPEPFAQVASALEPLPSEGFYRVREPFHCCPKRCRRFDAELLVQLGYDAAGQAIVFVPEMTEAGLAIPATGTAVETSTLGLLAPLRVEESPPGDDSAEPVRH